MTNMAELPSLAELLEFVKELRMRAQIYLPELKASRELVKSSLVEPFLRLLGFDPEDPADTRPMYKTSFGVADYALFNGDELLVFVVVYGLDGQPNLHEMLEMCVAGHADYLIVTNGLAWQVYRKDGVKLVEWDLNSESHEELFTKIDKFRRFLGLESGKYEEELECYTRGGREVKIRVLDNMDGLFIRRMMRVGKLPYAHIAKMLSEGKTVFMSGGVDNKNITYIRKRIEREVGSEVECFPAVYGDVIGYSFTLKSHKKS